MEILEKESIVYNEDCMIGMARYPDKYFDLAVVDPPYGINLAFWDKETPTNYYFDEIQRVSINQIIWGGNYFINKLPITEAWICWHKKPFLKQQAHFELAWSSFEHKPKMFEYTYAGNAEGMNNIRVDYTKRSIHPAQKPIALYDWIYMNYLPEGGKVIDTHLGSGSNRIAADKQRNIDFYGWEIDKDYFEAQEKRWQDYKSQLTFF